MKQLFEIKKYFYYKIDGPVFLTSINKDIILKEVTFGNYKDIVSYNPQLVSVFESFLKQGKIGLYGYINGQLVTYGWAYINKKRCSQRVRDCFKLPSDSGYVFYCRVLDAFQGKKIYQTLLCQMYQRLWKEINNIYIDTNWNNISAQRAITKSGGLLQGKLVQVCVLGRTLFVIKRVCK